MEELLEICRRHGVENKLSEMLRVSKIEVPPPWEENRILSNLEFKVEPNIPEEMAFRMLMRNEYEGYITLFNDGSKVD